jgi:hypothetical protein
VNLTMTLLLFLYFIRSFRLHLPFFNLITSEILIFTAMFVFLLAKFTFEPHKNYENYSTVEPHLQFNDFNVIFC